MAKWIFLAVARIAGLLQDSKQLEDMGRKARRFALGKSWTAVLDGLLAEYEGVVERRKARLGDDRERVVGVY